MYSEEVAAAETQQALENAGYEAYFVGGCVRDALLRRRPTDYDIVTNATPDQIKAVFPKTLEVGVQFGVVKVVQDQYQIDVATFRQDGDYSDSRRPDSVSYTKDVREDVQRRDFTINGILSRVVGAHPRNWIKDHVNGVLDLDARLIRTIGEPVDRFTEDPLRMLRAVRFAAQLKFTIEEETFQAILDMADKLKAVSRERIREELIKILISEDPANGIALLYRTGLAKHVLPHSMRVGQLLRLLETVRLRPIRNRTEFMLGLLASTVDLLSLDELVVTLRLSNAEVEIIREMINWRDFEQFHFKSSAPRAWMKRRLRRKYAEEFSLDLFYAYCRMGFYNDTDLTDKVMGMVALLKSEGLFPNRLLTSEELMQMNYRSDALGMMIRQLEDEQLEGRIGTKEQAIAFVERA